MRIQVDTKLFNQALTKLTGITKKSEILPIIEGVLMSANGNLKLTANNLNSDMTITLPAQIIDQGQAVANSKILRRVTSSISDEVTEIQTSETEVYVAADRSQATIAGMNAKEFPVPSGRHADGTARKVVLDSSVFRNLLNQVAFAASGDEVRPILCTIQISFSSDSVKAATTDGFKIAEYSMDLTLPGITEEFSILIPIKSVREMLARLPFAIGRPITISAWEGDAEFEIENYRYRTNLELGKFPLYWALFPNKSECKKAIIDQPVLYFMLRKVLNFGSKGWHQYVRMEFTGSTVKLSTENEDIGKFQGELPALVDEDLKGFVIAVNSQFLYQIIQGVSSDEAVLYFRANNTPILVEDGNFRAVVMPMHLR
ncbi:MAG: DNA polymerase III subunit beta [Anaerolineaceae bacterium]|nr:DNA polymerase III subunit beta [Anaerolineaceae bacterium]